MSKHIAASECLRSELELFSIPSFQSQLTSWKYIDFFPVTSLDRSGPLEFVVQGNSSHYLDLNESLFLFECCISNGDGSAIEKTTTATDAHFKNQFVAPINSFHSSHFKSIEIYLNGVLISQTDNLYAYKAFFQKLLGYDLQTKESVLELGQFYNDSGTLNAIAATELALASSRNKGLTKRYAISANSATFSSLGKIHSELFLQPKFIPAKHEIRIKLHRSDPAFSLIAKDDLKYSVDIKKAILRIKQYEVPPHVLEPHTILLEKKHKMKFPVKHVEMKYFTKSSDRSDLSEQNIVNGILPHRVIVGLVDSAAFNGTIQTNPLNFQHFDLSSIVLRESGVPIPYEEISVDFANNLYQEGFFSLYQTAGKSWDAPNNLGLRYDQYKTGYALYGFNLSNTADHNCLDLIRTGKLSLNIKLSTASTTSITIIVYLEYNKVVEIDKDGNVSSFIE